MERFSKQLRNNPLRLTPYTDHEIRTAPYALDWDMLFVGQCIDGINPHRPDIAHVYEDDTVPPVDMIKSDFVRLLAQVGLQEDEIAGKRSITPTWKPTCTMGYAITKRGAQRMLLHMSYLGLNHPVDIEIAEHTQLGELFGYNLTPPPFSAWRVGGKKDSDNKANQDPNEPMSTAGNRNGDSLNIRVSARKAMVHDLTFDTWEAYEKKWPVAQRKAESKAKGLNLDFKPRPDLEWKDDEEDKEDKEDD